MSRKANGGTSPRVSPRRQRPNENTELDLSSEVSTRLRNSSDVISKPLNNTPPVQYPPNAYYELPVTGKGPVGSYYAHIMWDGPFQQWELVRIATPMDGNCLFHAISNSYFEPYHTEKLGETQVERNKIVSTLRQELSELLDQQYESLSGGNMVEFSQSVSEFALEDMKKQLASTKSIGYGYMEFIGNVLNKDIYILEAARRDLYITNELPYTIKGNRNSIILYYMNDHYELVAVKRGNEFDTYFEPTHSLIRFLYGRVLEIVG
jgi:hypothetical protein